MGINGMQKLGKSLIGIGLKLKGGSMTYQAQLKKDARVEITIIKYVKFYIALYYFLI